MSSGLIIVVDDNPTFRKMYTDFLTAHGYTVMAAKSGYEGMKLLLNCTPRVLVLDISMPDLDGIETCKQVRNIHGGDIPILFLTAFNDVEKLRDCMHAGGDDYLIKSGNLESVLERIRFWTKATNRQEARMRRKEVVREIDNTICRIEQAANESKGVDNKAGTMSRLMAAAQYLADDAGLEGRENKLYVIGYAAGIVSHWSDTQLGVKARFMDYLRAALSGSFLLKREDISEVMGNYDKISSESVFILARKRAREDCEETKVADEDVIIQTDDEYVTRRIF